MTDVTVNYKQYSFGKQSVTKISETFDKKVTVNNTYRFISGMTTSGDGNIVISGCTGYGVTFIIVVDVNGRMLKEKKLNQMENTLHQSKSGLGTLL